MQPFVEYIEQLKKEPSKNILPLLKWIKESKHWTDQDFYQFCYHLSSVQNLDPLIKKKYLELLPRLIPISEHLNDIKKEYDKKTVCAKVYANKPFYVQDGLVEKDPMFLIFDYAFGNKIEKPTQWLNLRLINSWWNDFVLYKAFKANYTICQTFKDVEFYGIKLMYLSHLIYGKFDTSLSQYRKNFSNFIKQWVLGRYTPQEDSKDNKSLFVKRLARNFNNVDFPINCQCSFSFRNKTPYLPFTHFLDPPKTYLFTFIQFDNCQTPTHLFFPNLEEIQIDQVKDQKTIQIFKHYHALKKIHIAPFK